MKSPARRTVSVIAIAGALSAGSSGPQPQADIRLADLVGEYWVSDGGYRTWSLTLRANRTFTSTRFTGDLPRDASQPKEGIASVSSGLLGLVVPPGEEFSLLLRPVRLDGRLYLLPLGDELSFCIDLAEGREPRKSDIGKALLRRGDERKPVRKSVKPPFCEEPGRLAMG